MAFSPDGKTVVSGSEDKTIRLWSLDGTPLGQPFQGHRSGVKSVAFSPDGKTLVSGSEDKTLRLWSLDGTPLGQPFQGHRSGVKSVAFSPDGKTLVSGSFDNTIHLWRGNWQAWLGVCSARLGYHLVSADPEIDLLTADPGAILRSDDPAITTTQKACATCQKYAWAEGSGRRDLAQILRRQGNDLARLGNTALAAERLRQAAEYGLGEG
ncbi:hypothetical protein JOY44_21055 [Phormidium sp. CLA17]|uniref:WD40 repeat domain-containing protein n=1 Tax=Leptolyngbya sp. Cla-17 TaxID=2803751 RepID=UPI001932D193|nr:hypothetical protein [Leptolyngbya sp. Cla-17]MBM0744078.1 hypothetical protein [Leptolyngbya sp. Cla-17]